MTRSALQSVSYTGASPTRQRGWSAIWLAGLVGGALGCAMTAVLLMAAGVVPGALNDPERGTTTDTDPVDAFLPIDSATAGQAPTSDAVMDQDGHAELHEALRSAAAERSQLAATLVSLARKVDELGEIVATIPDVIDGSQPAADAPQALGGDTSTLDEANPDDNARRRRRDNSVVDSLLAAGIDPAIAADLQQRNDAFELARLDLVDRASREGDEAQLEQRLDALEAERPDLRAELGDDAYDRFLYESGDANRVAIGSVIAGSAAAAAGLDVGDVVLGYAGERLFRFDDLQSATRSGSRGETVTVEIERDGQVFGVDMPRGPLGVTLSPLRREP